VNAKPAVQTFIFEPRIEDERWNNRLADLDDLMTRVFVQASIETGEAGLIDVLFTNDAEMRALNKRWRNLDQATDVLSFPSQGRGEPDQPAPLGDIALGFETVLRDAEAMGRPFEAHVSHLLIHGFLHLLGYDHIEAADAAVMEPLEAKILASLGWPDPYSIGPGADEDRKG
jgi:probable rRNA maturation factor